MRDLERASATSSSLVLMYHGVHESPSDPGHYDPRYSVVPATFERQMRRLSESRKSGINPRDSCSSPLITFDDGDVSNALRALPCLVELSLQAVFFVTSGNLDRPGWLSRAQLRALSDAGMPIGAHGATHRFLNGLDARELRAELTQSRDLLEQASGQKVNWLALPGGRGGLRELDAAREAGYVRVFGSQPGDNQTLTATDLIQRVAIVRDMDMAAFDQILAWKGAAVRRLRWRHRLLALPKALIGDAGYDRLRSSLVR